MPRSPGGKAFRAKFGRDVVMNYAQCHFIAYRNIHNNLRVRLYWSERKSKGHITSRESYLMFTWSSNKGQRKISLSLVSNVNESWFLGYRNMNFFGKLCLKQNKMTCSLSITSDLLLYFLPPLKRHTVGNWSHYSHQIPGSSNLPKHSFSPVGCI